MAKKKNTQLSLEAVIEVVLDTFFKNEDPLVLELLRTIGHAVSNYPDKHEFSSYDGAISHMESAVKQRRLMEAVGNAMDEFIDKHPHFDVDESVELKVKKFETALQSEVISIAPVSDADKVRILQTKKLSVEEFLSIEQQPEVRHFMVYLTDHLDLLIKRYSRNQASPAEIQVLKLQQRSSAFHPLWIYTEEQLVELSKQLHTNGFTETPMDFYTLFKDGNFKCKWNTRTTAAFLFGKLFPNNERDTNLSFIQNRFEFSKGQPDINRLQSQFDTIKHKLEFERKFLNGYYLTLFDILTSVFKE